MNKKPTITVLLVALLAPAILWIGATSPAQVAGQANAQVALVWQATNSNGASVLLPTGVDVVQHQSYKEFKALMVSHVKAEIPEAIRNSWPFQRFEVDDEGHKPEFEVRDFLDAQLTLLNAARDTAAEELQLPNPPDFSLTTGEPAFINYDYWNNTQQCLHAYPISLGGIPWTVTDPAIGATATLLIRVLWKSDI